MTLYETETGSVYEVDEDAKRVRRVVAAPGRLKHTLSDGAWHTYEKLDENYAGHLLFWWPSGAEHQFTVTSRVTAKSRGGVVRG